ncbi:MAG TPA: hypothetical protein VM223_20990 [Planctomycetota bacterium]|nr:hypothetical protein [Planctomycetota bacterium]
MDEEYISFNQALRELGISEADFRAMITRGQIRPIVRGGRELFRRVAIDNLKKSSKPQPTEILHPTDEPEPLPLMNDDEPLGLAGEEPAPLKFEDEPATELPPIIDDDESSVTAETVMPTIELTPEQRQPAGGMPPPDDEHTEVATQEVSLSDNEDYLILEDGPKAASAAAPEPVAAPQMYAEPEEQEDEIEYEPASPIMFGLMGILTVLMLLSLFVFVGAATGCLPTEGAFRSISDALKNIFL